jgi:hypothetical protein
MTRLAAVLAVLVSLALPAAAGARTELSLTSARQAVGREVALEATEVNAMVAEVLTTGNVDPAQSTSTVLSYGVEPCDRETAYRVLCDYTTTWSDGVSCDLTAEVVQARRIHVKLEEVDEEAEAQDCHPT